MYLLPDIMNIFQFAADDLCVVGQLFTKMELNRKILKADIVFLAGSMYFPVNVLIFDMHFMSTKYSDLNLG